MSCTGVTHAAKHAAGRAPVAHVGAAALFVAITFAVFRPLAACDAPCTVDLHRWAGPDAQLLELGGADVNLNTWILAWVQHALAARKPLFEANIFHPAPHTLAASEHMLAPALLTAPLRAGGAGADAVHGFAIALSFFVAGASTYALSAWLTASPLVAAAAGVLAMMMPWRLSEIGHSQLLWIAWLPAVWLLVARCLTDGARAVRLAALAAVWSALVFSSYYVAFYACATTAVFVLVVWAVTRAPLTRLAAAAAALAVPLAALAAFSLHYLDARAHGDIVHSRNVLFSLPAQFVFDALAPQRLFAPATTLPFDAGYSLPLGVLVLAAASFVRPCEDGVARGAERARGAVVAGLWCVCALALLMTLGREVHVGDVRLELPAGWAARWLPGFELLRAPLRWAIVLGVALPVAAAAGLHVVRTRLARRIGKRAASVVAVTAALAAAMALVPPTLPVTAAYPEARGRTGVYDVLAGLPYGPALEVPWPRVPLSNAVTSSEYMVASTRHWRPLLNGYSGYKPRGYDFLVRVGARLPERAAVERLSALTGLRWIVVHLDALQEHERETWVAAPMRAPLAAAHRDDRSIIYEVVGWERGGGLRDRLRADVQSPTVLSGLPREPLVLDERAGALAASFPVALQRYDDGWANQSVRLRIRNNTPQPWPGIDPDPDGLVHVRYRIFDTQGGRVAEGLAPLDEDVPAHGTIATEVLVGAHMEPGAYVLRFDLVQLTREEWRPLGLAPVEGRAQVADVSAGGVAPPSHAEPRT